MFYTATGGVLVRTGRRQSIPSNNIDSCARVNDTDPFPAFGQTATLAFILMSDDFAGYVIAKCAFPLAHGFAFVGDAAVRGVAVGYLPLVLGGTAGPRNLTSPGEVVGH